MHFVELALHANGSRVVSRPLILEYGSSTSCSTEARRRITQDDFVGRDGRAPFDLREIGVGSRPMPERPHLARPYALFMTSAESGLPPRLCDYSWLRQELPPPTVTKGTPRIA